MSGGTIELQAENSRRPYGRLSGSDWLCSIATRHVPLSRGALP